MMKTMKRLAALALAGAMAVSMTACGGGGNDSDKGSAASSTFTFGCDYFSEYIDPSVNVNSAWSLVRFGVGETLFAFDEEAVAQENLCDEASTDDFITWNWVTALSNPN